MDKKDKKNFLISGGLISMSLLFSGCALFLFGAGAAGGLAISKDTIEGHFDKKLDPVWKASREVLVQEGFIRLEDRPHGRIEAEVRKSEVKIEILPVSEKTVRIRVKARKGRNLLPNPDLANELYNKIFHKLE